MSEVTKFRDTATGSNPTGVTEVSPTNPLPTSAYSEDTVNGVQPVVIKPMITSDYNPLFGFSSAAEKSNVISIEPGNLRQLTVKIDKSAASDEYYIHVGNFTSVPADATAITSANCILNQKIDHTTGTDSVRTYDLTEFGTAQGRYCSAGIVVWISTTEFTKTLVGSNIATFDFSYTA